MVSLFRFKCQLFALPSRQVPVVVESKASKINNCVVEIVLLFISKNKSATKTILFEFILNLLLQNTLLNPFL